MKGILEVEEFMDNLTFDDFLRDAKTIKHFYNSALGVTETYPMHLKAVLKSPQHFAAFDKNHTPSQCIKHMLGHKILERYF